MKVEAVKYLFLSKQTMSPVVISSAWWVNESKPKLMRIHRNTDGVHINKSDDNVEEDKTDDDINKDTALEFW